MKVVVLTQGRGSEYGVVGVFISRPVAEEYVKTLLRNSQEPRETEVLRWVVDRDKGEYRPAKNEEEAKQYYGDRDPMDDYGFDEYEIEMTPGAIPAAAEEDEDDDGA